MRRLFLFLFGAGAVVMLAAVLPCFADEVAVLTNGFTIQHHRREVVGELTRLYISADGASFVDVPTADIDHYEEAPIPADPPPAKRANPAGAGGFPARPKTDLGDVVNQASGRYRLDPDLVNSVINAESGFNVRAVSPKGAQGLMQLMPATSEQFGVKDPFDPRQSVEAGAKLLKQLLTKYNNDVSLALAAYNAGEGRVDHDGGVPQIPETQNYVNDIQSKLK